MPWWGWLIISILGATIIMMLAVAFHFLSHFMDGF